MEIVRISLWFRFSTRWYCCWSSAVYYRKWASSDIHAVANETPRSFVIVLIHNFFTELLSSRRAVRWFRILHNFDFVPVKTFNSWGSIRRTVVRLRRWVFPRKTWQNFFLCELSPKLTTIDGMKTTTQEKIRAISTEVLQSDTRNLSVIDSRNAYIWMVTICWTLFPNIDIFLSFNDMHLRFTFQR